MTARRTSVAATLLAGLTLFTLTATPAQAGPGYALSFNGTSQYVTVPDQDALTCTNAFTWEAWVNITKTNWPLFEEWATIFAKDLFTSEAWFAIKSNGMVDVRFNGQSFSALSSGAIAFQTWQHVAVTWDGSNVRFYLNGQLDRTVAYSSPLIANTASGLVIGMSSGVGGYHFKGLMDELRLWNVARSQAEIQAAMRQPLTGGEFGLVAYWPFREGASVGAPVTTADMSGHGHNGTLVNRPAWVLSDVGWSQTLQLNGNNPLTNHCHAPFADPGAEACASPASLAAGWNHGLALRADGTVVGWGHSGLA